MQFRHLIYENLHNLIHNTFGFVRNLHEAVLKVLNKSYLETISFS